MILKGLTLGQRSRGFSVHSAIQKNSPGPAAPQAHVRARIVHDRTYSLQQDVRLLGKKEMRFILRLHVSVIVNIINLCGRQAGLLNIIIYTTQYTMARAPCSMCTVKRPRTDNLQFSRAP